MNTETSRTGISLPPLRPCVLVDASWYSSCLDGSVAYETADQVMSVSLPGWLLALARRCEPLRYVLLFWVASPFDIVVLRFKLASLICLALAALMSRPQRFVILEFMATNRPKSRLKRLLYPLFFYGILRPAVRRSVKCAHVLAAWEVEHYAEMFGIESDRFCYIPWPLCYKDDVLPEEKCGLPLSVLSAGRASCDWATLFKAAEGRDWPLTVICRVRDLELVQRLNSQGRATVMSEVPLDVYRKNLASATVSVICLTDQNLSSGQIRIMDASRAGVPIVATRVRGLEGYVADSVNALLVEPGDHLALRDAVEKLLADRSCRSKLRESAFRFGKGRTFEGYLDSIRDLVVCQLRINEGHLVAYEHTADK